MSSPTSSISAPPFISNTRVPASECPFIFDNKLTGSNKTESAENTRDLLCTALCSKYMTEILSAKATLSIYLSNSVGIGEHPQHLDEMDKLIDTIASNEDKLQALKKHVKFE